MIAPEDLLAQFAVTVGYVNARPVLTIRGEMDRVNAPELGAILDAVIERHRSVVVDLAEMDFMNGWGLGVIAARASRLRRSGGTLTIRSPSAMVLRLLDITGVAELVLVEHPDPLQRRLGAEQSIKLDGASVQTEPHVLARHIGKITAIPADTDVIDGALRLAEGVIMERERADNAYSLLGDYSRRSSRPFERAEDVVASSLRPQLDPKLGWRHSHYG
jgi:anti-sigma B factor antagonist